MAVSTDRVRDRVRSITNAYGLSISLALLLLVWYEFQLVVFTIYGPDLFQWLFTVESATWPTPGWILATLSHGTVGHLAFNAGALLVVGGFAERHLGRAEYLLLFLVVGTASSVANLLVWPGDAPSIGASGAIFGLLGYSLYHYARHHGDRLVPSTPTPDGLFARQRTAFLSAMIGLGFPLIVLQTVLQLSDVIPAGRAAVGAHAFGFLFGVLYEYWRPFLAPGGCD